jgi:hypothetical protein
MVIKLVFYIQIQTHIDDKNKLNTYFPIETKLEDIERTIEKAYFLGSFFSALFGNFVVGIELY